MMNNRENNLHKTTSFDRELICHITKRGSSGIQLKGAIRERNCAFLVKEVTSLKDALKNNIVSKWFIFHNRR